METKMPEEPERIFGAGRRSFRPTIDFLERRRAFAADLGAVLTPGHGLLPHAQAAPGHAVVRMLIPAPQARAGRTDRAGVSGLVGPAVAQEQQIAPGYLHTKGNQIVDSTGTPVRIVAVNWTGFQSEAGVVDGLWNSDKRYNPSQSGGRNYMDVMDQMKKLGFNTIRLPLSNNTLTSSPKQDSIDSDKNPDLKGLTSLQVLQKIAAYAQKIGMWIILDHHQSEPGNSSRANPLWYIPGSAKYTPQAWLDFWTTLATDFKNYPAVIGADLHNEPHDVANWGEGNKNPNEPHDWLLAAEQAGNAVLKINPNWLIVVEGVELYKGTNAGWGENLMGVKTDPVKLDVPNQLVYSPRAYSWTLPPVTEMDNYWGYIYRDNIAPVLVGEFGLTSTDDAASNERWYKEFVDYLAKTTGNSPQPGDKGISWAYLGYTPNSDDTIGVLKNTPGWDDVNTDVMDELKKIET